MTSVRSPGGFCDSCRGVTRGRDAEMEEVARWFAERDKKYGFRIPNNYERMLATGQFEYFRALEGTGFINGQAMYDLLGNHFDADALLLRVFSLIWSWATGGGVPLPPPAHPPAHILGLFQEVARQVRSHGLEPAVPQPFPQDVLRMVVCIDTADAPDWSFHLPPRSSSVGSATDEPGALPLAASLGRGPP